MDEPCSALDPIATAKVEELMQDLKKEFTLVIVTHNMQQAARVSEFTAFFILGRADRVRPDREDLHQPGQKTPRTTSPDASVRRGAIGGCEAVSEKEEQ